MLLLRQKENLFAGVDQAAYGEDAVILAHVRVEEDGIASGIDYFSARWSTVGIGDLLQHPCRGRDHNIGAIQAVQDGSSIPGKRLCGPRRPLVNGAAPSDQISVRHDHAGYIDGQIPVAEVIEVQNVWAQLPDQSGQELR